IGVALGVAFSGPELDVVDPTETTHPVAAPGNAPSGAGETSGPTATPPSGIGAARQPPPPAELPGPPPATPGSP
ncbi:MAG TPA: hypothetical protein VGH63_01190, partial [Polyangia bacterium]